MGQRIAGTPYVSRRSQSISTKLRTANISSSSGLARPPALGNNIGHWWIRTMFGEIPLPLTWPVYCNAFGQRRPTPNGWGRACPARRSFTARPTEPRAASRNLSIRGAIRPHMSRAVTSTSPDGIRFRSRHRLGAIATSACRSSSATAGNGPPRSSIPSPALNRSPFIPGTRLRFSAGVITS